MRKTCKCGNVLSDVLVPNKVVYVAYFEEEWQNQVKEILGGPIYKFIRTVWHCDKCDRLYNWEPKDKKLYTYCLCNKSFDGIECSCKDGIKQSNLLNVYSYNDFESFEIEKQIKNGEKPTFPRKVEFCPKCKRVYVQKNGNIKIFSVEEVTDLVSK